MGASGTSRAYIAVVGASDASPLELEQAGVVGGQLAKQGAILVCGGLGGVMQAACMAAKEAGGTTVGILPGSDREEANPYLDFAIATGLGELRNGLIVRCVDALIAVGGGWGTLSEIAFAMRIGRPVVGLGTWEVESPREMPQSFKTARDAVHAVQCALAQAGTAH